MQFNAAISSSRSGDRGTVVASAIGGYWVVMGLERGGDSNCRSLAGVIAGVVAVPRRQAGGEHAAGLEGGCGYGNVFVGSVERSGRGELEGPYEAKGRVSRGLSSLNRKSHVESSIRSR